MHNLVLVDREVVSCDTLRGCRSAAVEDNFVYFCNEDGLCKLDLKSPPDVWNKVSLSHCSVEKQMD